MKRVLLILLFVITLPGCGGCGNEKTGPREVTPEAENQQKSNEQQVADQEKAWQKKQREGR